MTDGTTFGVFTNPDGNVVIRDLPMRWGTALPGAGEFSGDLFYLTSGAVGWYYWNGASWIGPLGAGGGGGAPTTAQYVVMALDGTLTSERVLTAGAAISIVDGGANGNVTVSVPDAGITDAKLRNSTGRSVIGRASSVAGVPADIVAVADGVLREVGGTLAFGQITGVNIAANAVDTAEIAPDAVTNDKLADMNQGLIKGRPAGVGSGSPADLTAAQVKTILGVESTPTGTGFVHVTAGVQDAAAKLVDTADVNNDQITDAKLRNSGALSVIGRAANSSGDPADIAATATSDAVLRESGSAIGFGTVATAGIANNAITNAKLAQMAQGHVKGRQPGAGTGDPADLDLRQTPGTFSVPWVGSSGVLEKEWIEPHSATAVFITNSAGNPAWTNAGGTPSLELIVKATDTNPGFFRFAGTTFPGTPVDGQRCYRTDLKEYFFFDSAAAGWLSFREFEFGFGIDADTAATAFLKMGDQAGDTTFSATIGHLIGVDVRVVGLSLNMDASGTATIQVFDDGSAVTNATLALSAQQSKADEGLMSNTIVASSILGVKVTSGTIEGPARGRVRLRRFLT